MYNEWDNKRITFALQQEIILFLCYISRLLIQFTNITFPLRALDRLQNIFLIHVGLFCCNPEVIFDCQGIIKLGDFQQVIFHRRRSKFVVQIKYRIVYTFSGIISCRSQNEIFHRFKTNLQKQLYSLISEVVFAFQSNTDNKTSANFINLSDNLSIYQVNSKLLLLHSIILLKRFVSYDTGAFTTVIISSFSTANRSLR